MCKTFKFISGKWKVWCKIKGGAALILNSHYQKQIEDNEQMWHESNSRAVCATHTHPLLSERLLETHLFHIDSAGTQRHRSPPLISRRDWDIINPLCINEQLRSIHSSFPCSSLSFVPHFFHHNSPFVMSPASSVLLPLWFHTRSHNVLHIQTALAP